MTPCAALKVGGDFVHYYDFVHVKTKDGAVKKVTGRVRERLNSLGKRFEIASSRVVRTVGPNWSQVVLDLEIH